MATGLVEQTKPVWSSHWPDFAALPRQIQLTSPSAFSVMVEAQVAPATRPSKLGNWQEGPTASGIDAPFGVWANILAKDLFTARPYFSRLTRETSIRPENRRALAFLETWMSEPDNLGAEWWSEFEDELTKHQVMFRFES